MSRRARTRRDRRAPWQEQPEPSNEGFFNSGACQAFSMGLLFTAISVVRSYIIRRWFNAMLQRAAQRMAKAVA